MNVKCTKCADQNLHALAFQIKEGGFKHHIPTSFLICKVCKRIFEITTTGVRVLR